MHFATAPWPYFQPDPHLPVQLHVPGGGKRQVEFNVLLTGYLLIVIYHPSPGANNSLDSRWIIGITARLTPYTQEHHTGTDDGYHMKTFFVT